MGLAVPSTGRKRASGSIAASHHAGGRRVTLRAGAPAEEMRQHLDTVAAGVVLVSGDRGPAAQRGGGVADGIVGHISIRACSPPSRCLAHARPSLPRGSRS